MFSKLIKPKESFQSSYITYIEELGDEERYPFPLDFDHSDFGAMLDKINDFEQGRNLPEGYVASSTYWLIEDDELIGVSNLRHELNESLKTAGGHIGLGIRPSYRGQGLSIQLLNLTLEKAKKKGINPAHIHCYKDNTASARMIRACGGELDSELDEGGVLVQRYLVDLS
ncbi:GNAT family N-acetyltransferase [Marinicella sp. S1101]|uniref:GNAT family N-acetyltransferase n=1 Tax=Marinicella marina TaxID=2996016 RepID=UPI002260AD48|nr:GNAT family N-acetyltransferase [Marinicella marina]MCX7552586.1 GNAT family N-acetyltransferase [Marinicella marina]MDJ1139462.1 GNAT family N-acetyltransferase [Marinicella marina]